MSTVDAEDVDAVDAEVLQLEARCGPPKENAAAPLSAKTVLHRAVERRLDRDLGRRDVHVDRAVGRLAEGDVAAAR